MYDWLWPECAAAGVVTLLEGRVARTLHAKVQQNKLQRGWDTNTCQHCRQESGCTQTHGLYLKKTQTVLYVYVFWFAGEHPD